MYLTTLLLGAWLWANLAVATHSVDHGYLITGHIKDAQARPLSGQTVEASSNGVVLGNGRSDSNGLYRILLTLSDRDLDKRIRLRVNQAEGEIRVRFKVGDQTTPRVHRVDFIDGRMQELNSKGAGGGIPAALYYIVAVILVVIALNELSKRAARRARREARAAHTHEPKRRRHPRKRH